MTHPRLITAQTARRFLVSRHFLAPPRWLPPEPASVMTVVGRLGSLQFDPLDIAGRNHDLVLLARIAGYRREGKGKANTALYLFDVTRKEYVKLADLDATYACGWLPDSRRLLLWKARGQSIDQVKAIDRESKRVTTIAPVELGFGALAMSRDGRSLFGWVWRQESDVWMLDYGAPK